MDPCLLGMQNALAMMWITPYFVLDLHQFHFSGIWVIGLVSGIKYTRFVGDPHYIYWQLSKLTP